MPKASILIVDDEKSLRLSLAEAFAMEGYEVTTASGALEALEAVKAAPFDVLLADLMMPGIDGHTLLERVQILMPEAVIVIMTGQATVESAIRALKGGVYDYVLKPFRLEEILHVVSQGLNLRRLKQENLSLHEINRRLQEVDRIKSDLLSTITHEFRTPLTIIYGWLDLLLSEQVGRLTPKQRESILRIRQGSLRLGRLISNLLTSVELERGGVDFCHEPVHVGDLLGSVLEQLQPEIEEKGLEAAFEAPQGIPPLHADPDKLRLLFLNLVENAVQFNERGGRLLVQVRSSPPFVEISIFNSRGEIPRDRLKHLLKPFAQWGMVGRGRGLGLGLAVAKAIVEAHRGDLEIESGLGRGTQVLVKLPIPPGHDG